MNDLRPVADAVAEGEPASSGNRPSCDVMLALLPRELEAVRASLLDAGSMIRESSWTITEDGGVQEADLDLDFARAMATIVHLSPLDGRQTVTRRLAPQRWAFGWRIDESRVVVAEACYRGLARQAPSDSDVALVRRLCDARISALGQSDAAPGDPMVPLLEAANDQVIHPGGEAQVAQAPRPDDVAPPPTARRQRRRARMLSGLCVLVLAAAGLGYAQWHRSEALASEARRLQTLSEATLAQSLAAALARGDYGEVQSELDRFEALRYFDVAMVTNPRGKVVAKSDKARDVRIGGTLKPESVAGSRSIDLPDGAAQSPGRLYVWPYRSTP